jgi:hypothetical protein
MELQNREFVERTLFLGQMPNEILAKTTPEICRFIWKHALFYISGVLLGVVKRHIGAIMKAVYRAMEKDMIRNLLLMVAGVFAMNAMNVVAADSVQLAPAETENMKSLFNGKDLTGWNGDPRLWSVKDGAIHGETTEQNPTQGNTFLIGKDTSAKDFELRFSFRCSDTGNSGVQYRSKHITEGKVANSWVIHGYQHEIRNSQTLPNVAGFIYDEGGKRKRICLVGEKATWEKDGQKHVEASLIDQQAFQQLFKLNDWNDVVIIAKGNHIQHYLNNRLILDFTDNDPQLALSEGVIAFQIHAGKPMWTEFKNIRIKDLP